MNPLSIAADVFALEKAVGFYDWATKGEMAVFTIRNESNFIIDVSSTGPVAPKTSKLRSWDTQLLSVSNNLLAQDDFNRTSTVTMAVSAWAGSETYVGLGIHGQPWEDLVAVKWETKEKLQLGFVTDNRPQDNALSRPIVWQPGNQLGINRQYRSFVNPSNDLAGGGGGNLELNVVSSGALTHITIR